MEARLIKNYILFLITGFWKVNAQDCDITGLTLDRSLLIDGSLPTGPYPAYIPVSITCQATYMSNLETFSMCQGPDTWVVSPENFICSAPCVGDEWNSLAVTVSSGQYFATENVYEHNTVISLSCPEGSLEGRDVATCQDGSWTPSRGSTKCNLCGTTGLSLDPVLLINDVTPVPSYPVFDLISVSCQTPYKSNFVDFNMCLESGWITPLQDFECLAPCSSGSWDKVDVAIVTGQYLSSHDVYEHDTILEFSCSSGILEGTSISACQNGTWSPATDSVHCNQPCESPDLVQPEGTYDHGDIVSFTCLYSSDVYPSSTCLDGVWEPVVTCPSAQQPMTTMKVEGNNTAIVP